MRDKLKGCMVNEILWNGNRGQDKMKQGIQRSINILFLVIGCLLTGGLIFCVRQQVRETRPEPLAGFEVFCGGEEISALFPSEDGLWVGGRDGVKRLDILTGEVLGYVAEDLELIYAAEIIRAWDGSVWVGHNAGVTMFAPDGRREDFTAPVLTGGRVNTLLSVGNQVWAGTMEGASLLEERDGIWEVREKYTKENGLLADPVNVLACGENEIWFGSYLDNRPGGVSILTASGWQYLTVEEGLAHPYINAILPTGDKVLAACGQLTAGGLNQIERTGNGFRITDTFGVQDGIPGAKVRWLYLDSNGYLWITTESDGLILTKGTELTHPIDGVVLTWEQGLSDNEIKSIVETDEYYFLAGRYGLTRIEKQTVAAFMEGENDE